MADNFVFDRFNYLIGNTQNSISAETHGDGACDCVSGEARKGPCFAL